MKAVKFGTRYAESRGSVLFGWTNLLICCINTTPSAAVTQRLRAGCLSWLSSTVHLRHVSQNRLPASIGIASTSPACNLSRISQQALTRRQRNSYSKDHTSKLLSLF